MAGMSVFDSSLSTELQQIVLSVLVCLSLLVLVLLAPGYCVTTMGINILEVQSAGNGIEHSCKTVKIQTAHKP